MQFLFIGSPENKILDRMQKMLVKRGHSVTLSTEISGEFDESFKQLKDIVVAADALIIDAEELNELDLFKLAYAVEYRKPTLALYTDEGKLNPSLPRSNKNKNLFLKKYSDKLEMEDELDDFIDVLMNSLDAKLFMIIPPSVNKYLEWVAANTQHSKSDIVRSAVEEVAQKDKDYQKFLKKHAISLVDESL